MIISNKLNCIFVAIPKTATHAVRFALRKHMDEQQDWEQVGLYQQKKLPFDVLAKIDTGHIKALEASAVLDEKLWHHYFKFAVVRNPYDRFVSFCTYIHREDMHFAKQALVKMKTMIADSSVQQRILFRPQYEFVTNQQGGMMVDFIGHYENLQKDYEHICSQLGIRAEKLSRVNRSIRGPYQDYYDEELRAAVYKFYQQDFALFGYSKSLR